VYALYEDCLIFYATKGKLLRLLPADPGCAYDAERRVWITRLAARLEALAA